MPTLYEVPPTPKFLLRLPPDLRADLERIAEVEHRSLSNVIVYALRRWADAWDEAHTGQQRRDEQS
jgi:predicted transcriptional regulator